MKTYNTALLTAALTIIVEALEIADTEMYRKDGDYDEGTKLWEKATQLHKYMLVTSDARLRMQLADINISIKILKSKQGK